MGKTMKDQQCSKVKIICPEHGRQEIIMVGEVPVCTACIADDAQAIVSAKKVRPFRIIKEPENNVIQFPRKNERKD